LDMQNINLQAAFNCSTSIRAIQGDNPRHNRDYRNNPSLLVQTGDGRNIVIDVGKTFREGALRWFPVHGVTSVDAIVLTHEHMDAAAGLDDVRGFQKYATGASGDLRFNREEHRRPRAIPMPLYASRACLEDLAERFPWLLPKYKLNVDDEVKAKSERTTNNINGAEVVPIVQRHVASFDVHVIESFEPFVVEGIEMTPLPVMHGEDLVSMGFAFSVGALHVVYLSDISRMLPETLEYITTKLPQPTDVLVLDSLHPERKNPVHFSLEEAVELVKQIAPKRTYIVVSKLSLKQQVLANWVHTESFHTNATVLFDLVDRSGHELRFVSTAR